MFSSFQGEDDQLLSLHYDLAKHNEPEMFAIVSFGASITKPIADQGQNGGDDYSVSRTASVKHPESEPGGKSQQTFLVAAVRKRTG